MNRKRNLEETTDSSIKVLPRKKISCREETVIHETELKLENLKSSVATSELLTYSSDSGGKSEIFCTKKRLMTSKLTMNQKKMSEETNCSIKIFPWSDLHQRREIASGGEAQIIKAELKPENLPVVIRVLISDESDESDEECEALCREGQLMAWRQYHQRREIGSGGEGEAFSREAQLMARLHHPNIISFLGVVGYSTEGRQHILNHLVLEYMPGGNLENMIKEDKDFVGLPWKGRVLIALQIASAMEYVHSMGLIHFDLKSANVLLDSSDPNQPSCRISDFGFANEKQDDLKLMDDWGTYGYMAPEVYFERSITEKITEKCDVYSFGIIMYELLDGKKAPVVHPFNDEELRAVFVENVGRHSSVPEWCYHQWKVLIGDCIACEAAKRPAFTEVASRLRDLSEQLSERSLGQSDAGASIQMPIIEDLESTLAAVNKFVLDTLARNKVVT